MSVIVWPCAVRCGVLGWFHLGVDSRGGHNVGESEAQSAAVGACMFNTNLVGTMTRTIAQNGTAGIKYTRRRCCHGWTNPILQTRERRRDHP